MALSQRTSSLFSVTISSSPKDFTFHENSSTSVYLKRSKNVHFLPFRSFFLLSVILFFHLSTVNAFWLPPDYWVTIYRNGQIESGRNQREFIEFPEMEGTSLGYWINNTRMHQEAYGNVELSASNDPQPLARPYCGNFVDISTNWGRQICGGFRILAHKRGTQMPCPNPFTFVPASEASPFMAVEYLDTQIARIQLDDGQWVFGGAKMAEGMAYAVDPRGGDGPLIRIPFITGNGDRVYILQRSAIFPPEDLLDDSRPRYPQPQPLPPIPEPPPPPRLPPPPPPTTLVPSTTTTSTTTEIMTTTTTMLPPLPPDELPLEKQPSGAVEEEYDDELSGAGIEWGALFSGNGIEEVEQRKSRRSSAKELLRRSLKKHRRRRSHHHYYKHRKRD